MSLKTLATCFVKGVVPHVPETNRITGHILCHKKLMSLFLFTFVILFLTSK